MTALIPARSGSRRCRGKNIRPLAGHPLLAYTIAAAQASEQFSRIIVSTDSSFVAAVAEWYGVLPRHIRISAVGHQDTDPDIRWITEVTKTWPPAPFEIYALLRPTSPFRTAETIRRAVDLFGMPDETCDSLRAVRTVTEHPGKMWEWKGPGAPLMPLLGLRSHPDGTPWHSSPTQSLPPVFIQTSSLEIFWASNVTTYGTISGRKISPFFCEDHTGFSIDTEADWAQAEALCAAGVELPRVDVAAVSALSPQV